jgi:hypothetical protein
MATGSGLIKSIKSVAGDTLGSIKSVGTSIKNWWKGTPKSLPKAGNQYSRMSIEELEKSKLSYEKLIKKHLDKLKKYANNPSAYDNTGQLANAPNDTIRDLIIKGRNKK